MLPLDQLLPCGPGAPPAPPWFKCSLSQASGHHSDGSNVIRARAPGRFSPGEASRVPMRGVGRVGVALDVTCGCSGLELRVGSVYRISQQKGPKTRDGDAV